jgi:hypothetical protein
MRRSSCFSPWPMWACRAPAGFVGEFLTLIGVFQVNTWVGVSGGDRRDLVGGLCAVALPSGRVRRSDQGKPEIHHRHGRGARRRSLPRSIVMTLLLGVYPSLDDRYHRPLGCGACVGSYEHRCSRLMCRAIRWSLQTTEVIRMIGSDLAILILPEIVLSLVRARRGFWCAVYTSKDGVARHADMGHGAGACHHGRFYIARDGRRGRARSPSTACSSMTASRASPRSPSCWSAAADPACSGSRLHVPKSDLLRFEYPILVDPFAVIGMMVMVSSGDLIVALPWPRTAISRALRHRIACAATACVRPRRA